MLKPWLCWEPIARKDGDTERKGGVCLCPQLSFCGQALRTHSWISRTALWGLGSIPALWLETSEGHIDSRHRFKDNLCLLLHWRLNLWFFETSVSPLNHGNSHSNQDQDVDSFLYQVSTLRRRTPQTDWQLSNQHEYDWEHRASVNVS